jgi:hypothetical protein
MDQERASLITSAIMHKISHYMMRKLLLLPLLRPAHLKMGSQKQHQQQQSKTAPITTAATATATAPEDGATATAPEDGATATAPESSATATASEDGATATASESGATSFAGCEHSNQLGNGFDCHHSHDTAFGELQYNVYNEEDYNIIWKHYAYIHPVWTGDFGKYNLSASSKLRETAKVRTSVG